MTKVVVPNHGSDHCPGGPDPIPCLSGYPIIFRAAVGDIDDPEADRQHYSDGFEQNVFWDEWDPAFDPTVYTIDPYLQTNDPDEGEVIAGVQLMRRGLYSIHSIVDVDEFFNGVSVLQSNYDEGQGEFRAHSFGEPGEPYWGDICGLRLDHWRVVYTRDTTAATYTPDALFGGGANTVEIVLNVNTETAMPGVTPGKNVAGTPTTGQDFWIPGGHGGAWGLVPNLIVAYWGPAGMPEATWSVDGDDWPPVGAWS